MNINVEDVIVKGSRIRNKGRTMVGQKERIMRRFERESKTKQAYLKSLGISCICGESSLALFTIEEIRDIIFIKDLDEVLSHSIPTEKKE